jgi:molybdate transport system substrate-binding protein
MLWRITRRAAFCAIVALLWSGSAASADDIRVMTSGGFTAAFLELVPAFERATGHKVVTTFGGSMGDGPETIPNRLQRGEPADIVILASTALDQLMADGQVVPGSRVDLVRSTIGMAVRAGAPRPDITTVPALIQTLLNAKSIGYSASASGVYLSTELFTRLGIAEQVLPKSRSAAGQRVGVLIARGEVEIGFQQVSELLPEPGIDYVGEIPAEVQRVTLFSAGLASRALHPEPAKALIRHLASPDAYDVIRKTGLEPAATPASTSPVSPPVPTR